MTCIIGIRDGGTLWMGADRCVADGLVRQPCGESKILSRFTRCGEPVLIGAAGDVTYCQQWNTMALLRLKPHETGYDYVVRLMASRSGQKLLTLDPEDGEALVAIRGMIVSVDAAGAVNSYTSGEATTGSGYRLAMGSLGRDRWFRCAPEERILSALQVAAAHDPGVMGPFDVVSIPSTLPLPPRERRRTP
jgi:20S proteasome alpha/beta subunit